MTAAHEDIEARIAALPCWHGRVTIEPLVGGMTNRNFVAVDGMRRAVVRVGDDIPVHGIVRRTEVAVSRAAHAAGLAPALLHAAPGLMVLDYVDAVTFKPDDVRNPSNLPRLVALLRRCHHEIPLHLRGPAPMFWVFHVLRDYVHTLREGQSRYAAELGEFVRQAEVLERAVGPIDIVFGHNDLLAANILDDGRRLWLIDWEYAGFNSALFDLGGLASNNEMPADLTDMLVEAYFGRPPDDMLHIRIAAMTAASLLRETLWSMVSEQHAALEVDFSAYTRENRTRFEAAFARYLSVSS